MDWILQPLHHVIMCRKVNLKVITNEFSSSLIVIWRRDELKDELNVNVTQIPNQTKLLLKIMMKIKVLKLKMNVLKYF